MDVKKILEELRFERDLMEDAILNLERLRASGAKRRGRPPKWLQEARSRQPAEKKSTTKRASPKKKKTKAK
jgi:hypothetical protein